MLPGPVPPPASVPSRWLLLAHERWLARRASDRFQRLGLRNPSQLRAVAKHGTVGLVMLVVAATEGTLFGVAGLVGIIALLASGGASFAYWILGVAVVGVLYAMARLLQVVPARPNERDLDFLARAGWTVDDAARAEAREQPTN